MLIERRACTRPSRHRGMVARGDGNTNNLVGGGSPLTPVGGVSYSAGEVGQAFSLNGSGSYLRAPSIPALNTNQLTIED
jgi:hypothetical protein